ncbi:MAG: hypothetical protein MUE73_12840, partial [Planctomycetes bacterium]|nr:hypothetical protein [Planctomycetota bacterium]
AVLVGAVFIPEYAALDEGDGYFGPSSFAKLVRHLRARAGRKDTRDEEGLFERLFIALHSERDENLGDCAFFDVMEAPPRVGRPAAEKLLTFRQTITAIIETYDERNQPPFRWAGEQEPPAPADPGR